MATRVHWRSARALLLVALVTGGLAACDDDGPARRPEELQGDEKARYQALRAELDRMTRELVFAY